MATIDEIIQLLENKGLPDFNRNLDIPGLPPHGSFEYSTIKGGDVNIDPDFLERKINSTEPKRLLDKDINSLAWYQPIHYFKDGYGIFITSEGVDIYEEELWEIVKKNIDVSKLTASEEYDVREVLTKLAFNLLKNHEYYHHLVESFCILSDALNLVASPKELAYLAYRKNYYDRNRGTDDCYEEGLAQLNSYKTNFIKIEDYPLIESILKKIKDKWKIILSDFFKLNNLGGYRLINSKYSNKNLLEHQKKDLLLKNLNYDPFNPASNHPVVNNQYLKVGLITKGTIKTHQVISATSGSFISPLSFVSRDLVAFFTRAPFNFKLYKNRAHPTLISKEFNVKWGFKHSTKQKYVKTGRIGDLVRQLRDSGKFHKISHKIINEMMQNKKTIRKYLI